MRSDEDRWFGRGDDGFSGKFPVVWQDWATIGIFIGFVAAVQLLIPRSSLVYYPAFGVGGAIFLALYARKTRIGRRWLERLTAALPNEPGRAGRTKRTRR